MSLGRGRIAFSRWEPGDGECLFVMHADGSQVRQLTTEAQGQSYCPSWSPDGGRICFVSRRNDYTSLYVIEADGSNEVRLTAAQRLDDDYPAWSPDGRTIAFCRGNGDGPEDLWLFDVASRAERRLTHGGHMDYRPTWSPDGRSIAFRRSLVDRPGVYLVGVDGGAPRFVIPGFDPSWSPQGDRLAYVEDDSLRVLPIGDEGHLTGETIRVTCERGVADSHPSWSADGTHIVFEREPDPERDRTSRIMVIRADGGDLRDLGDGRMPDWSPGFGLASGIRPPLWPRP